MLLNYELCFLCTQTTIHIYICVAVCLFCIAFCNATPDKIIPCHTIITLDKQDYRYMADISYAEEIFYRGIFNWLPVIHNSRHVSFHYINWPTSMVLMGGGPLPWLCQNELTTSSIRYKNVWKGQRKVFQYQQYHNSHQTT